MVEKKIAMRVNQDQKYNLAAWAPVLYSYYSIFCGIYSIKDYLLKQ